MENLSDYSIWILKLIQTEKFVRRVKKSEKYIFISGIFEEKKISKKVKISFAEKKSGYLFDELNPKLRIYDDTRPEMHA